MTSHNHFYQQIPSGTSVHAGFTLIPDADALPVINSRGNGHLDFLSAGNIARPMAVHTFLLNHLPGSVTLRTGLHVSDRAKERLLSEDHLSLTAALLAGFRTGSGLCSRSPAGLTLIL